MRRFSIVFTALAFVASAAVTFAQTSPTIVLPSQIKWSTQHVPKGVAIATVAGAPSGTGMYVMRLKMADGAQFAPHTHGKTEMVSVLSGTLLAGIGSKFDKSKM